MKSDIEVWVVEVPDKVLKCFGLDKDAAMAFAKEYGKEAAVWDMMQLNEKGYNGDPKEKA